MDVRVHCPAANCQKILNSKTLESFKKGVDIPLKVW